MKKTLIVLFFSLSLPLLVSAQVLKLNQISSSTQAIPYFGVLMGSGYGTQTATASSSPTVGSITASSTTATSQFNGNVRFGSLSLFESSSGNWGFGILSPLTQVLNVGGNADISGTLYAHTAVEVGTIGGGGGIGTLKVADAGGGATISLFGATGQVEAGYFTATDSGATSTLPRTQTDYIQTSANYSVPLIIDSDILLPLGAIFFDSQQNSSISFTGDQFEFSGENGQQGAFNFASLTAPRTWTLPNFDGTFCMIGSCVGPATSTHPIVVGWISATTTATSTLPRLSSTGISTTWLCLTGDVCRTTWPTGATYPFTPTSLSGIVYSATTSPMLFYAPTITSSSTVGRLTVGSIISTSTVATSTFAGAVGLVNGTTTRDTAIFDIHHPTTIGTPTGAAAVINYGSGNYSADLYSFQYRVYAFKTVGSARVYSVTYSESTLVTDDGSTNPMYLDVSWNAVLGASGYKILIRNDFLGCDFPFCSFETSATSFQDGNGDENSFTSDVTVTPMEAGPNLYVNRVTGDLISTASSTWPSLNITSDTVRSFFASSINVAGITPTGRVLTLVRQNDTGNQYFTLRNSALNDSKPHLSIADTGGFGKGYIDFFTYGTPFGTETIPTAQWRAEDLGGFTSDMVLSTANYQTTSSGEFLKEQVRVSGTRGSVMFSGGIGSPCTATYCFYSTPVSQQTVDRVFHRNIFEVASSTASATTTHFAINNIGYTGIGTSTPGATLSVNQLSTTGLGIYLAGFRNSTADLFRVSTTSSNATSTAFVINSQGRVGTGTTTPDGDFSVSGGSRQSATKGTCFRAKNANANSFTYWYFPTAGAAPTYQTTDCGGLGTTTITYD